MKKRKILEYYVGNPDTIEKIDDSSKESVGVWRFSDDDGISFGWFQTSLDGGKEFVAKENTCHYDLTKEIGRNILGKATNSEELDDDSIEEIVINIGCAVNFQGAFKGRTFSEPKVITTWHKVSSEKLYEILENLGGVEKFMDYRYVFPEELPWSSENFENVDGGDINVIDYINSHDSHVSLGDIKNMSLDIKSSKMISQWLIELIRTYNEEATSKLATKTSKLGNMTIAQYNSLIHQEERKPKNIIKENNMEKNKYQKEFSNYISIMAEALKRNDFKVYEFANSMLEETINECKQEKALLDEMNTNNFGVLNHIFEQELPKLLKVNKRAVRNVIKTIKEDRNLIGEFNFYNVIKNQYKGSAASIAESNEVLDKLAEISVKDIDQNTVIESNKKLRKVMVENNVTPSEFIDAENKELYESCHAILTKKKSANNMLQLIESYNVVCNYMDKHKDDKVKNGGDFDTMIENFENNLKENLNESEISFVQQITDFRSPIAEQRREKLFSKFKNECLKKIDDMLKEDSDNTELNGLSKQINEMKYNKETIIKDLAKLLEIRDILMDD